MINLMYARNRAQLPATLTAFLFSIVPDDEKHKIESLYRLKDRQASLLGKLLLYKLLEKMEGREKDLSRLIYTTNGKPLLERTGVSFNISHSGDYVVCAMTDQQQIGVDIEKIEEVD